MLHHHRFHDPPTHVVARGREASGQNFTFANTVQGWPELAGRTRYAADRMTDTASTTRDRNPASFR
jgi:hypothetical protein